jgi:hypothetical protein
LAITKTTYTSTLLVLGAWDYLYTAIMSALLTSRQADELYALPCLAFSVLSLIKPLLTATSP